MRRSRPWPARLAMALLLAWLPARAELPPDDHLQFADGLYARGLHDTARAEYEAFLAAHAGHPRADAAWFRLGECARAAGDHAAAGQAYYRVIQNFPASPFVHRAGFRRAETFLELRMDKPAAELFAALLERKPPDDLAAAALYLRAEALRRDGQAADAEAALRELLARFPKSDHTTHALLALAELRRGGDDGKEAVELLRRAAENPATPRSGAEAWFQLGETLRRQKDWTGSARAFAELARRYPDDTRTPEARLPAAWAHYHAGLFADALRFAPSDAGAAPSTGPADEWLYLRANCLRQLARAEEALSTYDTLLTTQPRSRYAAAAAYEKALVFYRQARYAEAIAQARSFAWPPETEADLLWLLAESHAALKQRDEAVQFYRRLLDAHPASPFAPDSSYRLAHLLQQQGEYAAAAAQYHRFLAAGTNHAHAAQALFAAGVCYAHNGEHEKAVRDWADLLQREGEASLLAEARFRKAMSEIRLERGEEARASLRTFLQRHADSPHAPEARFWLGVLLKEAGQHKDAEAELRKARQSTRDPQLQRRADLHLGLTQYAAGRHDEAARTLSPLLGGPEGEAFTPALLEWLAAHWLRANDARAALPAATRLAASTTADAAARQRGAALLGRAQLALGDAAAADAAFAAVLAVPLRGPLAGEASLRRGELALRAARPAEAEPFFRDAMRLGTTHDDMAMRSRAYAGLAESAAARGDDEAAARYYMSVAVLFDDAELVPRCLLEAANAYARLGREADRARALAELRERYPASAPPDAEPPAPPTGGG